MEYQDQEITCGDCGSTFPFSAEEQQFYAEKGLDHPPKRCKPCRQARKAQQGGRRGFGSPPRHDSALDAYQAGYQAGLQQSYHQQGGYPPHGGYRQGGYQQGGYQQGGFQRGGPDRPRGFRGGRQGGFRNDRRQDGPPLFKDDFRPRAWQGNGGPRGGRPEFGNERGGFRGGRPDNRGGRRPVQLYDAVCSDCSSETQVPFKPNGVQPVFCRTCLPKHKPRRARYGGE